MVLVNFRLGDGMRREGGRREGREEGEREGGRREGAKVEGKERAEGVNGITSYCLISDTSLYLQCQDLVLQTGFFSRHKFY